VRDRRIAAGMWVTTLAGISFGVIDVLAPLRLDALGASALVISGAFLGSAAVETALSPLVGTLSDRRGPVVPLRLSLAAAVAMSVLLPLVEPAWALVALIAVGCASYGTLFVPAAALMSEGAQALRLNQGIAFGLSNLAWAGGQAVAAGLAGVTAQLTSTLVPYALLAALCACTFLALQPGGRRLALRVLR
jgi:MFS family permease